MSQYTNYRMVNPIVQMRPYIVGEDLTKVHVRASDTVEEGGMIAKSKNELWYIPPEIVENNYEEV